MLLLAAWVIFLLAFRPITSVQSSRIEGAVGLSAGELSLVLPLVVTPVPPWAVVSMRGVLSPAEVFFFFLFFLFFWVVSCPVTALTGRTAARTLFRTSLIPSSVNGPLLLFSPAPARSALTTGR